MKIKDIYTLFFKNLGIKQTVIKNTFWLMLAEVIFRFSTIILFIYVARILDATDFGKFNFALAIASIFTIFSDFGLSDITTRELSQNKKGEKEYPAILSLRIFLTSGIFILILISSLFITRDPIVQKITWVLGGFALIGEFFSIIYSFFRARQRMEYECLIKIIQSAVLSGLVFFILFTMPSVKNISYGYLFGNLITLIFVLLLFHFFIHPLKLSFNKEVWVKFLKLSWPIGLAGVFGVIFLNIDSIIMGYFGFLNEIGWYNIARRTVAIAIIPGTLIYMSFYPVLNKFFRESRDKFQRAWNFYMELMIVLAVPVVVGGITIASQIVNFYGQKFDPSIFAFQILIFVAGIYFLCYPYILILIASGQQKKYLLINLAVAIINIVLNLILIPRYTLYGAAAASVITYVSFLFLLSGFSKYFTPISIFNSRLFKAIAIAILSSLIARAVFRQSLIYGFNFLLAIISGVLIYFAVLFFFYKYLNKFSKEH